jgi:16S rRNA processing protein RimM
MAMPELLAVGRIQRPHGLAGEVSVEIQTDFPERFIAGERLIWRRGGETEKILTLTGARRHQRRLLLTFAGAASVEAARSLCGGDLYVPASEAFAAPEGFYYSHEIEGFACEDRQGRPLGSATGLEKTPAGALLSVALLSGTVVLVPFVEEIVVRVDRVSRRIVLDPPEGLLEL